MQIIGHMKCRDTKKCFRWFSDRRIKYHFLDLAQRGLSPGEFESIARHYSWDQLINRSSKVWQEKGLEWMVFDKREKMLENPLLLLTPIVREGNKFAIGYKPEEWEILFTS